MRLRMFLISLSTLMLGVLVGTSVGILYAPRSGKATRAMLRSKGVILQEKVTEDLNLASVQVKDRIENLTGEARHKAVEIGDQLKDTANSISMLIPGDRH